MRIAEFTDSFLPIVDGVGTVVLSYANCLADRGHECYVVAPMTDMGYRGGQKFELVDFQGVQMKKHPYKLGLPSADAHFRARMKDIAPDIIHAHSPFTAGQTALVYARSRNVPIVGSFHSKYRDDFLQVVGVSMFARAGARLVADFYNKCDEVWTVSRSSADALREYGCTREIFVMPNGTDEEAVTPESEENVRRRFGIGDAPYFLFAGQLNRKKNIDLIFRAAVITAQNDDTFKLVLAGQGPHEDELRQRAEALGLAGRVIFTGHICNRALLTGLYSAAALFVFPSRYDTAGLVVREAALCETASVVLRGSAPAEVITDGVNGLICDESAECLASAMEFALKCPDDTKKMGLAAKMTVPISWDGVMDKVLERYQRLINSNLKIGEDKL